MTRRPRLVATACFMNSVSSAGSISSATTGEASPSRASTKGATAAAPTAGQWWAPSTATPSWRDALCAACSVRRQVLSSRTEALPMPRATASVACSHNDNEGRVLAPPLVAGQ